MELSKEILDKIERFEKNSPQSKQLQALGDVVDVLALIDEHIEEYNKGNSKDIQSIGKLLANATETLDKIYGKEDKEMPDYAKPIVQELKQVQKAFNNVNFNPVINVPKIDAPVIPEIKIPTINVPKADLSPIADILSKDLPLLIKQLIDAIPEPNNDDVIEAIKGLTEVTAEVRDKRIPLPTFPNQMAVTNLDGTAVNSDLALATRLDDASDPILYLGKAPVGSATDAAVWQIAKLDTSSGLTKTWAGNAGFTQIWDNRASLTFN